MGAATAAQAATNGRPGLTNYIASLAAIALVGLGGCSGNPPAADASIETNLTAVNNDALVSNDSALLVDPTPTTTGNTTGL